MEKGIGCRLAKFSGEDLEGDVFLRFAKREVRCFQSSELRVIEPYAK